MILACGKIQWQLYQVAGRMWHEIRLAGNFTNRKFALEGGRGRQDLRHVWRYNYFVSLSLSLSLETNW